MNYFRDPTFSPDYVPYYPHDSQGQQLCYAQTYAGDACLNLAGYAHTATLGGYQYNNIYQGPQPELQDSFLERAGYTGSMAAFPNMQFLDHSIDTSLPVQDLTSFNLQGSQASLTSIGGNAATVITPAGGEVITLASEFGVATSSAGSLYNEATGDAALFFPSSAAPSSEFPYIPPSGAAQSMGFMSQYSPTNPSMSTPSDIPPELAATTEMQLPRMQPFDMLSAIDDADMKKRNSRLDTHCIPTIDNDNQRSTLNSAQPIAVPNSADPSSAVTANEIAGKTPYLTPSPSSSRGTSPGSPARRVRRRRKLPAAGSPSAHGLDKRWKCPHCPYIQANKRAQELKRHIQTHDEAEYWVCCGVPVNEIEQKSGLPPGAWSSLVPQEYEGLSMVGGCWHLYSRKDALKRHLKRGKCCGDATGWYLLGNRAGVR